MAPGATVAYGQRPDRDAGRGGGGRERGGNHFWSLVAIVAGVLVGTFFMAFHSAQGPQLGLPQMIQSRPHW